MKDMHDKEFYARHENYKPIAVRQWRDEIDQTRYSWNEDKETTEHYANELVWLPALGNEHTHISLGGGFLYKKAQAEHEAKRIAEHLAKAFQNDKA